MTSRSGMLSKHRRISAHERAPTEPTRRHQRSPSLPEGSEAQYLPLFFKAATYERFGIDSLIFREACDADHFYLIHQGAVTLESFVPGRGETTVQTIGAGDALGWSWLFPPYLWHFSARAVEPTELVAFGAQYLRQQANEDPVFGFELVTRVANVLLQRLQSTRKKLLDFYIDP